MLEKAVSDKRYAAHAVTSSKAGQWIEPCDAMPEDLQKAEAAIAMRSETGLFNSRLTAMPTSLIGTGKSAVIYLDFASKRFWQAFEVCIHSAPLRMQCYASFQEISSYV